MSESRPLGTPGPPLNELRDLARRLMDRGGRRLLGIVGPPGSGKTTLAARLGRALYPAAVVVPADGFHLANRVLDDLGLAERKGAPETFDVGGLHCLLRRLRDQHEEVVYAPEFVRRIEEPIAGAIPVPRAVPLVIAEGNYLLLERGIWSGTAELFDEIWYLDVDTEIRQARLTCRHRSFGRSDAEARRWVVGSDERNARTVESTRAKADRIIPSSASRHPPRAPDTRGIS